MPIKIIRQDITKMQVDAIVSAANQALRPSIGGVNAAIHQAAGPELAAACQTLGGCKTGEAKITSGYNLPCRYVIHTVGPVWHSNESALLAACYRSALELAHANGCASIAFPLISSGRFGCPKDQALRIATDTIRDFLMAGEDDMLVYIVVFDKASFKISNKLYAGITQYIDDHYVDNYPDLRARPALLDSADEKCSLSMEDHAAPCAPRAVPQETEAFSPFSLEDALSIIDESFSQMVLRKIDEKGIKAADCYKRANIDRKLFSKIRNDIFYKPKKTTAVALAIALELSLSETRELLMKAGFALSHSSRFDIIIEYFITQGRYDIFEINEALYSFDEITLGV